MIKVDVVLDTKEIASLEGAKACNELLFKEFNFNNSNGEELYGVISVTPQRVATRGSLLKGNFLLVKVCLFGYEDMIHTRYLGVTEYVIESKNLEKVLFGEHIIVNQISGDRVLINVTKEN